KDDYLHRAPISPPSPEKISGVGQRSKSAQRARSALPRMIGCCARLRKIGYPSSATEQQDELHIGRAPEMPHPAGEEEAGHGDEEGEATAFLALDEALGEGNGKDIGEE